ncbi:hypothetical protein D8674_017969 [Pyrus ussuriensis x Pyrus communis]|uniref:Uncharacterized protein n=1 Tax=Pyrus ussuriensis x Pyrus communis TaxID=2448454 RepID=A0A5N5HE80_9ROSA|nr:hypothetical protein D8674_017969 [Pyrus ussuriensis x Pyrus communis]
MSNGNPRTETAPQRVRLVRDTSTPRCRPPAGRPEEEERDDERQRSFAAGSQNRNPSCARDESRRVDEAGYEPTVRCRSTEPAVEYNPITTHTPSR